MKGYILYDRAGLLRNRSFAEAIVSHAEKRGVKIEIKLREELLCTMQNSRLCLCTKDGDPVHADFIINRCIDPFFAEFAQKSGIRVFNSAEVCRICNDKRLTHMYFSEKDIPMADSIFLNKYDEEYIPHDFPKILKAPEGHGGTEVFYINSEEELKAHRFSNRLLQSPVKTLGRDLRVYVMNGEILCGMLRCSERDFRSNFSLGGSAEIYTPSSEETALITKVIKALPRGALYVGIDFIFDGDKMLLNEVEDIVGSRMLYQKTSIPVHELFTDSIIDKMNKGEQ